MKLVQCVRPKGAHCQPLVVHHSCVRVPSGASLQRHIDL
jgi:hypothetical protein